jgi:DNA-binding IclR family transcriptional regulator
VERLAEAARALARTRQTRTIIESAVQNVATARQRGYAVTYASLFPDTGAVAISLPPASDGNVLVLGVGGLQERIRRNERAIVRAMRSAISTHLMKAVAR